MVCCSRSCLVVGLSRVGGSVGLVLALTAALLVGSQSPTGAVAGYGDVPQSSWYTDAVQWAVDNAITGIAGVCFRPDDPVSRGETAVWIYNMENRPDAGVSHSFSDVTNGAQDDAISWMANTGITTGTSPTTFAPDETLRRAQAATFLHRLAGEPAAPPHNFSDVVAAWQQDSVSWMANTGITTGTSPTTFAPEDTLTRAQLVTFLYRYKNKPTVSVNPDTPICDMSVTYETATFVDSGGRRIRFRVHYRNHWDLNKPRGAVIFFHGSNHGTEDDMFWGLRRGVLERGLLFIRVASPGSYHDLSESEGWIFGPRLQSRGIRAWVARDYRVIHELLQNNLGGRAALDHDRIVFQGGSGGTSFLARFLERYFALYGGGFHAWCGAFWGGGPGREDPPRAESPWSPTIPWSEHTVRKVSRRMRVFVEATTEDFLHDDGVAMRDYYRDVLGLDTRWDLDAPGGHCRRGATPRDSILDWLSEPRSTQASTGTVDDHDGDGLANALDPDDDNDGALDVIDALPLEPRDWLDTDSDGIGDFADRDADGDGIDNALDAFSLDPTEWLDNDEDGIGDNVDIDDDNDGLPDSADPDPLSGPRNDQLTFKSAPDNPILGGVHIGTPPPLARVHRSRPVSVTYPEASGSHQSWHSIRLGDGADPVFEIMIDSYERNEPCEDVLLTALCDPQARNLYYYEQWSHKIYIDRNRNRDLTDDGPPLVMARNPDAVDETWKTGPSVRAVVNIPYSTGELLPYGLILYPIGVPEDIRLRYKGANTWMGLVSVPDAEPVLVGTVDANLDGVFNTGTSRARADGLGLWHVFYDDNNLQDFACVDTNRDGSLNECDPFRSTEPTLPVAPVFYEHEPFMLDGRTYTLEIAATGHTVRIRRLDT